MSASRWHCDTPHNHKPSASVIDMAISACKEEKRDQFNSRESQQLVREALNQGYCDGSGESLNLSLIGESCYDRVYAHGWSYVQVLWKTSRCTPREVLSQDSVHSATSLTYIQTSRILQRS